ncbi:MAG TPA: ATP-binding cassette domain-containing protein [Polyangiaceae bacterium]|nr:ATP-binding cassette domain-containing protein [Polyangiaceae bacterium]
MTAAIEARGLTKRFGSVTAVDHVDLTVEAGEFFGLLGPNGAGKTTLVRMMAGLMSITSGEARVAGIDVRSDPDGVRAVLGVVPQALTSDLDLTAYENMDIYARYFGVPRARRARRVEELLHRVGLWDRRKDLVKTFSGGMRRRLEIARGLIHKPRVLFLDEPTIGLDPQSRHVIWDLLRDLRQGDALTISLTTHYLDEADALCDRVAIVDAGRIVALGSPAELKARVPGSDTISIGLAEPPPPERLAELRAAAGVRDVSAEDGELTLRVDDGARLLPRLIEDIAATGATVRSASVDRISLEDVFIHFTGKSLRDESAPRGAPQGRRVV